MLLRVLLDLFEMLVVAILSQPGDNIAVRPVDLQRVRVLVVDVVLDGRLPSAIKHATRGRSTHVDRHLVNVDPLLDTEFRYKNIEGGI